MTKVQSKRETKATLTSKQIDQNQSAGFLEKFLSEQQSNLKILTAMKEQKKR